MGQNFLVEDRSNAIKMRQQSSVLMYHIASSIWVMGFLLDRLCQIVSLFYSIDQSFYFIHENSNFSFQVYYIF